MINVDFVNRTKPHPAQIWWRKYGAIAQFAALVLMVAIVGSVA